MDGAVQIRSQEAATSLKALEMRCDEHGIPRARRGPKPIGYWLCGEAGYLGSAARLSDSGKLADPQLTVTQGLAVVAIDRSRLLGILEPSEKSEPNLWWAWSHPTITVTLTGPRAPVRKAPLRVSIASAGNAVELAGVYRLEPHSRKYFESQELSLLAALRTKISLSGCHGQKEGSESSL